jgi:uncharacterized protein (TIGR02147 family)
MQLEYIDFLKNEFEARKKANLSYSLRSFARDLDLSPSRLCEVLSSKSGLSEKTAQKVASKIKLSSSETKLFVELVNKKHGRSQRTRQNAKEYIESQYKKSNISLDGFKVISDWYYFAMMSVMELDDYDGTASWIATRLGLDLNLVKEALETLGRLDYVEEKRGNFLLLKTNLTTTHDVKSLALRKYHKQLIHKAMESLDVVPVELRDITSMSMTFEKSKMKEAKELIKEFRRSFCQRMESGKREEVYSLNIQFIPLTNLGEIK